MRLKFSYILIILLMFAVTADAQRARKRKKTPARKTQVNRRAKTQTLKRETANAQDTIIKGTTIEIIQSYNPEVKPAPKPEFSPALPPPQTKNPVFGYDVPKQSLYYTYNSMPIRPLALGKDAEAERFANYVKLGGGNLSTLYLDAGVGSLKGENYETAIHLNHLSQSGGIENQKVSLTGLNASGTLHKAGHAWQASVGGIYNRYHYYGYNHNVYDYTADSVRQAFTGIRAKVGLKNEYEGFKNIDYNPTLAISSYSDRRDASERTFNLDVPFSYNVDTSLKLMVAVTGILTQYDTKTYQSGNNMLQLRPALDYKKDAFAIHAGISPTAAKNGTYILPDVAATYQIKNSQFGLLAGWQGRLQRNTFEELTTQNPFMYNNYLVQQTKVSEIYGGIQGNVGKHISFGGKVSYLRFRDMAMFINDTSMADMKQFRVVYDAVNALSLQGSVRYRVANTFAAGLSVSMYSYEAETFRHTWHMPSVVFKGDLLFQPLPELTVTAYLSAMEGMYAVDRNNISVKLSPIFDLGGGAEYSFIPRLSAFLQVNNLLNNKYQRWYGYDVYGLNVFGGLRLKF